MKLSLVVLTPGKQEGKVLPITLSQFVVGRDPQCHLRPASALISKRHCALLQRDGKVFIRDFGSTNGTFLNDQPVKGEVELHHDDRLKIGPLLFSVHIEAGTAVNRPTPAPPTKNVAAAPAEAKKPAPAPAEARPNNDDDIAAMLLSLQDDGSPAEPGLSGTGGVPEGSTVMDLSVPQGPEGDKARADKEKADKEKSMIGNTSNAAKSILEKYMKRPRKT